MCESLSKKERKRVFQRENSSGIIKVASSLVADGAKRRESSLRRKSSPIFFEKTARLNIKTIIPASVCAYRARRRRKKIEKRWEKLAINYIRTKTPFSSCLLPFNSFHSLFHTGEKKFQFFWQGERCEQKERKHTLQFIIFPIWFSGVKTHGKIEKWKSLCSHGWRKMWESGRVEVRWG